MGPRNPIFSPLKMWLSARVMLFPGVPVLLFFIQNGAHSAQPLLWVPKSAVLRNRVRCLCGSFVHDKGTRKEGFGFSISLKTNKSGFFSDSKCIRLTTDINKCYKNHYISFVWDSHFTPNTFHHDKWIEQPKIRPPDTKHEPFLLPLSPSITIRISVPSRHELVNTQLHIPRSGTAPSKTGSAEGMDFSLMKYG